MMIFSLPNFKNFAKEHTTAFVAGIILVLVIAGAMYSFITEKPNYDSLYSALRSGDYENIISKGESLLSRNPDDVTLTQIVANAYLSLGVITNNVEPWAYKAINLLTKSIKETGEDAESERLIGYGYFLIKDYNNARKHYQGAVTLDQNNSLAWADIGQLEEVEGNIASARALYDKAIQKNLKNATAHLGITRILMRQKEYEKASLEANLLLNFDSDRLSKASAHEILGQIALQGRNFTEAENHFNDAIILNAARPASLAGLALALIGQISNHVMRDIKTETERPIELATQAIAIAPDFTYGYVVLARIARLQRDDDAYKIYREKILALAPKDPTILPQDKQGLIKEFSTDSLKVTDFKIISIKKVGSPTNLGIQITEQK